MLLTLTTQKRKENKLERAIYVYIMERRPRKQAKVTKSTDSEEVSSTEWEFIKMTEQEEDLIHRMYRLVGDRWELIAGRIPGRTPQEIERYWLMRHGQAFADKRNHLAS